LQPLLVLEINFLENEMRFSSVLSTIHFHRNIFFLPVDYKRLCDFSSALLVCLQRQGN
jgi:hypothetical protein